MTPIQALELRKEDLVGDQLIYLKHLKRHTSNWSSGISNKTIDDTIPNFYLDVSFAKNKEALLKKTTLAKTQKDNR